MEIRIVLKMLLSIRNNRKKNNYKILKRSIKRPLNVEDLTFYTNNKEEGLFHLKYNLDENVNSYLYALLFIFGKLRVSTKLAENIFSLLKKIINFMVKSGKCNLEC